MTEQPATHPVSATFAFVDLAGFGALTEAHGDAEAVALGDRFEAVTTDAIGPTTDSSKPSAAPSGSPSLGPRTDLQEAGERVGRRPG